MKYRSRLIPTAVAGALLLMSCNGGDDSSPTTVADDTSNSTATSNTPSTPPNESTSVTSSAATAVDSTVTTTGGSTQTTEGPSSSQSSTAATGTTTAANGDDDATASIVSATEAFVATLTDDEKATVQFDFSDTAQRQNWSNLPPQLSPRAGLRWGDLGEETQNAWLSVLQATLSTQGYEQILGEWYADDHVGGGFSSENFYIAIIGAPSATDAWQWQWGGHHLAVNATIKGADISLTPSFLGVEPATYDADGKEVRPLGEIVDEAFALVQSLDDTQAAAAVLSDQKMDLVLGPGEDGKTIASEGVPGSDLTDDQKAALVSLIGHYGNLVNAEDGAKRMAELEANLDETYFAWAGSTTEDNGIYFRVTGPTLVIEYSAQDLGGNPAEHIHGMYRDPTNDYGAAFGAGLG